MNAIKSAWFIFVAIKPYIKRILLLPVIFLVFLATTALTSTGSLENASLYLFIGLFLFSGLQSAYVFYASDRVPQLFIVLPQRRVDFVRGVYLSYLLLAAADLVIGLAVLLLMRLSGAPDPGLLFFLGLIFCLFALIMSIELPVAFKVGYARMQVVFIFAVLLIGLVPTLLTQVFHQTSILVWALSHPTLLDNPLSFLGLLAAGLAGLTGSYLVSAWIFENKDI